MGSAAVALQSRLARTEGIAAQLQAALPVAYIAHFQWTCMLQAGARTWVAGQLPGCKLRRRASHAAPYRGCCRSCVPGEPRRPCTASNPHDKDGALPTAEAARHARRMWTPEPA